jgi:hypothetical protein
MSGAFGGVAVVVRLAEPERKVAHWELLGESSGRMVPMTGSRCVVEPPREHESGRGRFTCAATFTSPTVVGRVSS